MRTVRVRVVAILPDFDQVEVGAEDGYRYAIVRGMTPGVPFESLVLGEELEIDVQPNTVVVDVRRP